MGGGWGGPESLSLSSLCPLAREQERSGRSSSLSMQCKESLLHLQERGLKSTLVLPIRHFTKDPKSGKQLPSANYGDKDISEGPLRP